MNADTPVHATPPHSYSYARPTVVPGKNYGLLTGPKTENVHRSFPTICRLTNGELLMVYDEMCSHMCYAIHDERWLTYWRENGRPELTGTCRPRRGRLLSRRSADEGRSWSQPGVVVDTEVSDRDAQISVGPDGTVYLVTFLGYWAIAPCGEVKDKWSGQTSPYKEYPYPFLIGLTRSYDNGHTWEKINATPWQGAQTEHAGTVILPIHDEGESAHDPIHFMPDGALLLPVQWRAVGHNRGSILVSNDHGRTWRVRSVIAHPTDSVSEHAICHLGQGRLICAMRPGPYIAFSEDCGRNWTVPERLADSKQGEAEKAPYFLKTSSNGLLLFECTRDPRMGFTVRISREEGGSFSAPMSLDAEAGNPHGQAVELADGSILAVYHSEGPCTASEVRAIQFRIGGENDHEHIAVLPIAET